MPLTPAVEELLATRVKHASLAPTAHKQSHRAEAQWLCRFLAWLLPQLGRGNTHLHLGSSVRSWCWWCCWSRRSSWCCRSCRLFDDGASVHGRATVGTARYAAHDCGSSTAAASAASWSWSATAAASAARWSWCSTAVASAAGRSWCSTSAARWSRCSATATSWSWLAARSWFAAWGWLATALVLLGSATCLQLSEQTNTTTTRWCWFWAAYWFWCAALNNLSITTTAGSATAGEKTAGLATTC